MTAINKTVCADLDVIQRLEKAYEEDKEKVKWSDAFKLGVMEKLREKETGKSLREENQHLSEKIVSITSLYQKLLKDFEKKSFYYDKLKRDNDELRKKTKRSKPCKK
jgi:hypothetical protein